MFPNTIESFSPITLEAMEPIGEEMQELINKIDELPIHMKAQIIENIYGNMKIENNQMTIYDTTGTIIRVFDLKDIAGESTTSSPVFERIIV